MERSMRPSGACFASLAPPGARSSDLGAGSRRAAWACLAALTTAAPALAQEAGGSTPDPMVLAQTYGPLALGVLVVVLAVIVSSRRRRQATAGDIQAIHNRVKILLKNKRPDEAAREIDQLGMRIDEIPVELEVMRIQALYESHQDEAGDAAVDELDRSRLDLKRKYELGRAVERAGRDSKAEALYKEILAEDPDYADVPIRLERVGEGGGGHSGAKLLGFGFDPSSISRHLGNRYMSMELVGKGGMGFVFKAFDQKRKRVVAIKALSPFLAEEEEAVRRFMREAKILSQFEHPNVVKIFDVEEKPIVYYTMEFLKGRTLGHRLEEEGPLSVKELLTLSEALLLGLVHIHKHGVVHRDIKPENVLLDTDGTPRFTDFGLAVGDQATRITQQGQVMGTLRYMAPEQMRGEEVGPVADIFSLGVTLYEAVTGIHAFSGDDRISRALTGRVHEVTDRDIPNGVQALIELMMETVPEDRVQTAEEALEMVRQLQRETTRKGPVTFLDETLNLRARVVQPLAGFFAGLVDVGEEAQREFFEESSNVRDLKLLVWRMNEVIGRIQGSGKPPKGTDPRGWARETGQLRTDLARFVRHMDLKAIPAFSLRLRRLEKQLEEFVVPFRLALFAALGPRLEEAWGQKVMLRFPEKDVEAFGAPDVVELRDELFEALDALIREGRPVLQELAIRTKVTAEGDRWLLQLTGEGVDKGHAAAEATFEALGAEVGFPEPGVFKAWLPFVCESRASRQKGERRAAPHQGGAAAGGPQHAEV